MGLLDDILGKIIDVNLKLKAGMMGVLNIKTTKNTYNTNLIFTTPEASKAFARVFVAGNQKEIVEYAEKLLAANSATLEVMSLSSATEIANATIVASAAAASGMEGKVKIEGKLGFEGNLSVAFVTKSTEPEK